MAVAHNNKKVLVAMSGGVDSSTAAALLVKAGYDCLGAFMIIHDRADDAKSDAEKAAEYLGIRLEVLDLRRDFQPIIDYFCSEYTRGRTPNPCVWCNRDIKFGKLWDFAKQSGADYIATGHYAQILEGEDGLGLYAAADSAKDQSYALSMIKREILPHILLPIGTYSKKEIRKLAAEFGLHNRDKGESQEICFIPNNDYAAALERHCPQLVRAGNIVDAAGKVLGTHTGIHRFTIGQRRGLRVALGEPAYVVKIDASTNTVILGSKEHLQSTKLIGTGLNWLVDRPPGPFRARVKIRYNHPGAAALVTPHSAGAVVQFDNPIAAITPGQLSVFYLETDKLSRVAGAGWIDSPAD